MQHGPQIEIGFDAIRHKLKVTAIGAFRLLEPLLVDEDRREILAQLPARQSREPA